MIPPSLTRADTVNVSTSRPSRSSPDPARTKGASGLRAISENRPLTMLWMSDRTSEARYSPTVRTSRSGRLCTIMTVDACASRSDTAR